jgi:hypothetical protein
MDLRSQVKTRKKIAADQYDCAASCRFTPNPTLMRALKTTASLLICFISLPAFSQDDEFPTNPSIAVSAGFLNYQGDLNPNSFSIGHSNFAAGITLRQPLSRWFTARAGFMMGQLEAADQYNRDYLQARNLSFFTSIKEFHAGLEISLLDITKTRFTPYLFGGVAVFKFNPWAYDNSGNKTFLQPLSTEGQGIEDFPSQKPYKLTQVALPFGIGIKYACSDNVMIGFEFSQRKTFTDYLDDVSSFYVDRAKLEAARGSKAVEMAYRGIPSSNASASYPTHGEQRGTPSEMDWYYFGGLNIEVKLSAIGDLFRNMGSRDRSYMQRCPKPL